MEQKKKQLTKYLINKYREFLKPNFLEWYNLLKDKSSFIKTLQTHEFFNIDWIELFPNEVDKWDFKILSKNRNFNFSWVEKFPNSNWDFTKIAFNNIITQEWIEKYIDKEWLWGKKVLG